MSNRSIVLTDSLYEYMNDVSLRESPLLLARRYWQRAGVDHKIDLRLAPATETLDALIAEGHGGTSDFACIDADKMHYLVCYERTLALLPLGDGLTLARKRG